MRPQIVDLGGGRESWHQSLSNLTHFFGETWAKKGSIFGIFRKMGVFLAICRDHIEEDPGHGKSGEYPWKDQDGRVSDES